MCPACSIDKNDNRERSINFERTEIDTNRRDTYIVSKVWVAPGKSWPEFVYFAVEICHCGPLPSATPDFSLWQKLYFQSAKHQRHRRAWVGQADFRKVEPNNGNHSGNCQCLSA